MSLVSDALRKARQEAAQRQAQQQGAVVPGGVAPRSGHRTATHRVAIVVVSAAVAGVCGGSAVWWLLQPAPNAVSSPAHSTAGADDGGGGAAQGGARPAGEDELEQLHERAMNIPETIPTVVDASDDEASGPSQERDTTLDEVETELEQQEAAPPPAVKVSEDGSSNEQGSERPGTGDHLPRQPRYVVTADLGEVSLTLEYLVYREHDPFARINGVEVFEGSHVEGFVVVKIERTQVTLRDEQGELVLSVR